MLYVQCEFISLWFLQTLTDFYNIWHVAYPVTMQHNNYYWSTRLAYVLLLGYLVKKSTA